MRSIFSNLSLARNIQDSLDSRMGGVYGIAMIMSYGKSGITHGHPLLKIRRRCTCLIVSSIDDAILSFSMYIDSSIHHCWNGGMTENVVSICTCTRVVTCCLPICT